MRAVAEMIEIAEGAEIPVEIAHFKMMGPGAWGKVGICLAMVDDARARGYDVTADWYPYAGWHGGSNNIVPPWASAEAKRQGRVRRAKTTGHHRPLPRRGRRDARQSRRPGPAHLHLVGGA